MKANFKGACESALLPTPHGADLATPHMLPTTLSSDQHPPNAALPAGRGNTLWLKARAGARPCATRSRGFVASRIRDARRALRPARLPGPPEPRAESPLFEPEEENEGDKELQLDVLLPLEKKGDDDDDVDGDARDEELVDVGDKDMHEGENEEEEEDEKEENKEPEYSGFIFITFKEE
eukprot:XP_011678566.1 PREDICTED: uncharacterized protein LOC105445125 [Strongylocentrotus purpuratus]